MANHKSALKRMRQNEKRRAYNRMFRSRARTFVKRARISIDTDQPEDAVLATRQALRELDRAASKGIIHKRNAARRKSRLMARLNKLTNQA